VTGSVDVERHVAWVHSSSHPFNQLRLRGIRWLRNQFMFSSSNPQNMGPFKRVGVWNTNENMICNLFLCVQGRIQPVSIGGGDFSDIWQSSLITGSLLWKRWSILSNTVVMKQCKQKALYCECCFTSCTKSWCKSYFCRF